MDIPKPEEHKPLLPPIIDGPMIEEEKIVLPPEIISGILSMTEKMELVGGAKTFKTWALIDQALSVAGGNPWWGKQTFLTPVVYLNFELHQPFFEQRLFEVSHARKFEIPPDFHVIHLRGYDLSSPVSWGHFIWHLKDQLHRFEHPLLISDPIYKMLGNRNENSAGDINSIMNQLEDLVQQTEGANCFGHHHTKGNQAEKEAIDRGSGSGVFSRDPDTLMGLTAHEHPGGKCYTLNTIVRNHAPIEDSVLEWKYPLFVCRHDLDPQDLKKRAGGQVRYEVAQVVQLLGNRCLKTSNFCKRVREETGMASSTFHELLKKAEKAKLITKNVVTEEWETLKPVAK
jgi:hypothetical protein